MGTYVLQVTDTVAENNGPFYDSSGVTENLLNGVNTATFTGLNMSPANAGIGTNIVNMNARFNFSLIAPAISLDGGPLIAFAGLPFGWIATSAVLTVSFTEALFNGDMYLQFSKVLEKKFPFPVFNGAKSFTYPSPPISALDLFSNGWGVRFNPVGPNDAFQFGRNPVNISGNYALQIYNISGPITFGRDLANNNAVLTPQVTITALDRTLPGLLQGTTKVGIRYTNALGLTIEIFVFTFILISEYILIFTFPDFTAFPFPPVNINNYTIVLYGDGKTFSGSTPVATLQVLFENGSGIYVLNNTKRDDTLYLHSTTTKTTTFDFIELEDDIEDSPIINPTLIATQGLQEDETIDNDIIVVPRQNIVTTPDTIHVGLVNPFITTGMIGS